jgi:hypothetical protein
LNQVVPLVRNETPVSAENQIGVTVPELVSNDRGLVSIPKRSDCVGVPPVMESRDGELQQLGHALVDGERSVLIDAAEDECVLSEVSGVAGENLPRPEFSSADDSVTPSGFASLRVDAPLAEINIPPRQPLDYLPLNARSGHQRLYLTVGLRKCGNQGFRLLALQPEQTRGVGLTPLNVTDGIVGNDLSFNEPLSEYGDSSPVSVLSGAGHRKGLKELGDSPAGQVGRGETVTDKSSDLGFVLRVARPLVQKIRKVWAILTGEKSVEHSRLIRIEKIGESDLSVYYSIEYNPPTLAPEVTHHILDSSGSWQIISASTRDDGASVRGSDADLKVFTSLGAKRHRAGENGTSEVTPPVAPGEYRTLRNRLSLCSGRDSDPHSLMGKGILRALPISQPVTASPEIPPTAQTNEAEASRSKTIFAVTPGVARVLSGIAGASSWAWT